MLGRNELGLRRSGHRLDRDVLLAELDGALGPALHGRGQGLCAGRKVLPADPAVGRRSAVFIARGKEPNAVEAVRI